MYNAFWGTMRESLASLNTRLMMSERHEWRLDHFSVLDEEDHPFSCATDICAPHPDIA